MGYCPLLVGGGAAAGIRTQLGVRPFGLPDRGRGSNTHMAPDIDENRTYCCNDCILQKSAPMQGGSPREGARSHRQRPKYATTLVLLNGTVICRVLALTVVYPK